MRTSELAVAQYTYLRTQDVADRLGISRAHVIDLIAHGQLKAINVGLGRRPEYRVSAEALDQFVERRAVA